MSPVFRHGGLRLYLLKLLDEAPRHGYDVIRLLQDRFLGVYSPSPGTIYPRLARLEAEGLVTHDMVDGKKVYKITDAGREELNRRLDDLADLEDELSASVRDIAREITRDVRETVRNLRDEFTWAVRDAGKTAREPGTDGAAARPAGTGDAGPGATGPGATASGAAGTGAAGPGAAGTDAPAAGTASAAAGAAAAGTAAEADAGAAPQAAAEADADAAAQDAAEHRTPGQEAPAEHAKTGDGGEWSQATSADEAGAQDRAAGRGGWREWADWAERRDWREWAAWAEQRDWREWAGKQEWKERAKASHQDWKEWAKASKQEWAASGSRRPDTDLVVDLERLAAAFARELRGVAWQAEALSEDAVGSLGRILTDALNRIKNEVFRAAESGKDES